MKDLKKYIALVIFVSLNGAACALALKAAIGVGAWDAFTQTMSKIFNIKVGTMGIILNCSCILGPIILLKKDFKPIQLLQAVVSIVLGIVVNFMLYDVYTFTITAYWQSIVFIILAYILMAILVGAVMTLDIVTFSLEGFCLALEKVLPLGFAQIRQAVDVICIILCIIISFILPIPLSIREGTVIGMIIFAPLMGYFMKIEKQLFLKWDLIEK